jgi:hypothetical protein
MNSQKELAKNENQQVVNSKRKALLLINVTP